MKIFRLYKYIYVERILDINFYVLKFTVKIIVFQILRIEKHKFERTTFLRNKTRFNVAVTYVKCFIVFSFFLLLFLFTTYAL